MAREVMPDDVKARARRRRRARAKEVFNLVSAPRPKILEIKKKRIQHPPLRYGDLNFCHRFGSGNWPISSEFYTEAETVIRSVFIAAVKYLSIWRCQERSTCKFLVQCGLGSQPFAF